MCHLSIALYIKVSDVNYTYIRHAIQNASSVSCRKYFTPIQPPTSPAIIQTHLHWSLSRNTLLCWMLMVLQQHNQHLYFFFFNTKMENSFRFPWLHNNRCEKKNGEKKCSMWKLSFHLFVYTALFLVSIWTASFYYVFISGMCNLNRIVSLVVEHIETNVSSPITLMLFLFTTILYSVCFVLYTSKALEAKSSKIHASTRCVWNIFQIDNFMCMDSYEIYWVFRIHAFCGRTQ